ncbi:MAG: ABC transporter substrate-binding protein [Bradymonadia bacterium]
MSVRRTIFGAATCGAVLYGCSLAVSFDDECSVDGDCAGRGAGFVCSQNLCVLPGGTGGAGGSISGVLTAQCPRFHGVPDEATLTNGNTLILGTLLPLTGALEDFGPPIEQAVYLAVDEINQVGGVAGRPLAVISCDSASDAEAAQPSADHLFTTLKVPGIVGAASSAVTIGVFNSTARRDSGALMISPASTSPGITDLPDEGLLWRTIPSDAAQGLAIGELLLFQGYERVAVVNRDDSYGNGLRDAIIDKLRAEGFPTDDDTRFANFTYRDETQADDQSQALVALGNFEPDIIVLVAFPADGTQFLNDAALQGFKRFVLPDGFRSDEALSNVQDDELLRQIIGTNPASPSGDTFQSFRIRYRSRWGDEPAAFDAQAYDATYMLAYAIAAVGTDQPLTGARIAAGLRRLSEGESVESGNADFNRGLGLLAEDAEATIDYLGTSGPLDMNGETGEAPGSIEGWFFDLDRRRVDTLGEILSAEGEFTPPSLPNDMPDEMPDMGAPDAAVEMPDMGMPDMMPSAPDMEPPEEVEDAAVEVPDAAPESRDAMP